MKDHIDGIDYLRAIMSVFVVIWHVSGGGQPLNHIQLYHRYDFKKYYFKDELII